MSSQECLVRLERGDYEELKAKEVALKKIEKENKNLNRTIEELKISLLDRYLQTFNKSRIISILR